MPFSVEKLEEMTRGETPRLSHAHLLSLGRLFKTERKIEKPYYEEHAALNAGISAGVVKKTVRKPAKHGGKMAASAQLNGRPSVKIHVYSLHTDFSKAVADYFNKHEKK